MSDPANDQARGERIAKWLARAGVASRRDAEKLVAEGRVRLNNEQVTHPATFVTADDIVVVNGTLVEAPERTRLWRYHKPDGLVTTHRDPEGRPTVFDKLPPALPRVVSIGRLDLTSEGLLLLTNDGALARRLELPATGWIRRYRVRVHGRPDERALERLAGDPDVLVRAAAFKAAGALGCPPPLDTLAARALRRAAVAWEVRAGAAQALAAASPAIAVRPLVAAVSDPHANVRKAAVTALAPMRAYPGAAEALHAAASDGDADVRAYARYAVDGGRG